MIDHSETWPIDMAVLTETAGQNASHLLPQLIPIFLEDGDSLMERMARALQIEDATQLQHAAHRLKGNSASLGVTTLAHMTNELENLGKVGDLAAAVQALALLSEEYNKVKVALLALLNRAE